MLPRPRLNLQEQAICSLVELIETNPDRYNEGLWFGTAHDGGTAMCLASLVCLQANLPVERLMAEDPTGESVTEAARGLLGLDRHQAQRLFDLPVDTTVDTLKAVIARVLGITFGSHP